MLPGLSPFIAETEAAAKRLQQEFNAPIQPGYSLLQLRQMRGVDFTGHDFGAPFPRQLIAPDNARAVVSRFQVVLAIVDREKPTLCGLLHRLARAHGYFVLAGTPEQAALPHRRLIHSRAGRWLQRHAPWLPGGFDAFATEVVPLLRRRLFREAPVR